MYIPETQKLTLPAPTKQGDGFSRASSFPDESTPQRARRELKRRLRVMEAGVAALQERCRALLDAPEDEGADQQRNALHLHARLQSLHAGIQDAANVLARLEQTG